MKVNFKVLSTFLAVAEHTSFRKAAEQLHLSLPAVSMQVKQLEDRLGVALFQRTTRRVELTAEGEALMISTRKAMAEIDGALARLQQAADAQQGHLSFACVPTVASTRLPPLLVEFSRRYPGITVQVCELTQPELLEAVRRREVDFGIGPSIETSEFHFEPVMEDPLYALVPKRLLTTSRRSISLATLTNMPLLVLSPATALRGMLETAMQERHLAFTTRYEFSQAQTLISMATAGLGAAILPKIALPARVSASTHVLRISNPTLVREVSIITMGGQHLSPASLRLVQLIKELLPNPDERRRPTATAERLDI